MSSALTSNPHRPAVSSAAENPLLITLREMGHSKSLLTIDTDGKIKSSDPHAKLASLNYQTCSYISDKTIIPAYKFIKLIAENKAQLTTLQHFQLVQKAAQRVKLVPEKKYEEIDKILTLLMEEISKKKEHNSEEYKELAKAFRNRYLDKKLVSTAKTSVPNTNTAAASTATVKASEKSRLMAGAILSSAAAAAHSSPSKEIKMVREILELIPQAERVSILPNLRLIFSETEDTHSLSFLSETLKSAVQRIELINGLAALILPKSTGEQRIVYLDVILNESSTKRALLTQWGSLLLQNLPHDYHRLSLVKSLNSLPEAKIPYVSQFALKFIHKLNAVDRKWLIVNLARYENPFLERLMADISTLIPFIQSLEDLNNIVATLSIIPNNDRAKLIGSAMPFLQNDKNMDRFVCVLNGLNSLKGENQETTEHLHRDFLIQIPLLTTQEDSRVDFSTILGKIIELVKKKRGDLISSASPLILDLKKVNQRLALLDTLEELSLAELTPMISHLRQIGMEPNGFLRAYAIKLLLLIPQEQRSAAEKVISAFSKKLHFETGVPHLDQLGRLGFAADQDLNLEQVFVYDQQQILNLLDNLCPSVRMEALAKLGDQPDVYKKNSLYHLFKETTIKISSYKYFQAKLEFLLANKSQLLKAMKFANQIIQQAHDLHLHFFHPLYVLAIETIATIEKAAKESSTDPYVVYKRHIEQHQSDVMPQNFNRLLSFEVVQTDGGKISKKADLNLSSCQKKPPNKFTFLDRHEGISSQSFEHFINAFLDRLSKISDEDLIKVKAEIRLAFPGWSLTMFKEVFSHSVFINHLMGTDGNPSEEMESAQFYLCALAKTLSDEINEPLYGFLTPREKKLLEIIRVINNSTASPRHGAEIAYFTLVPSKYRLGAANQLLTAQQKVGISAQYGLTDLFHQILESKELRKALKAYRQSETDKYNAENQTLYLKNRLFKALGISRQTLIDEHANLIAKPLLKLSLEEIFVEVGKLITPNLIIAAVKAFFTKDLNAKSLSETDIKEFFNANDSQPLNWNQYLKFNQEGSFANALTDEGILVILEKMEFIKISKGIKREAEGLEQAWKREIHQKNAPTSVAYQPMRTAAAAAASTAQASSVAAIAVDQLALLSQKDDTMPSLSLAVSIPQSLEFGSEASIAKDVLLPNSEELMRIEDDKF